MSLKPDLVDPALTSLGIGPGLFFPKSDEALVLHPRQRWELVRRHPYYLKCWRLAQRYHQYHLCGWGEGPKARDWPLAESCAGVLRGLGVRIDGPYIPDPARSWDQLQGGVSDRNGAGPVSCRELALQLLAQLPDDVRKLIGQALQQDTAIGASFAVNRIVADDLDKPLIYMVMFAPSATEEVILAAVAKAAEGAGKRPRTRRRPDAIDEQLKVWDLREGWTGSGYDGRQEYMLRVVATRVGAQVDTVQERYRRAFQLIIGRPYCPDLWQTILMPLKFEGSLYQARRKGKRERTGGGKSPKMVSETTLFRPPRGERQGDESPQDSGLDGQAKSSLYANHSDIFLDIKTLLEAGKPDRTIVVKVRTDWEIDESEEKDRAILDMIGYVREGGLNRLA
jgi:hypothetical protein